MRLLSDWLIMGICSVSLLLGFLTGASSSPIAGTVIAAILGGAGTIWAARITGTVTKENASTNAPEREPIMHTSELLGIGLTLLAVSFLGGIIIGAIIRANWPRIVDNPPPPIPIPWEGGKKNPPDDPQVAWRWLSFSKDASALGLSTTEIQSIYSRATTAAEKGVSLEVPTWPTYETSNKSSLVQNKEEPQNNGDPFLQTRIFPMRWNDWLPLRSFRKVVPTTKADSIGDKGF